MDIPLYRSDRAVTLLGGGVLEPAMLEEARAIGPEIVAADGGADPLARLGLVPAAIIGDLDSVTDPEGWRAQGVPLHHVPEQDTTDFEKCLYSTEAPLYLATGFTGARLDHTLAVLHVLMRYPAKSVVLLGEADAVVMARPGEDLRLGLEAGARVSIFPLRAVRGARSAGLEWPIDGLEFEPGRMIGTSNRAVSDEVVLRFDGPGALLLLERRHLRALVAAIAPDSLPAQS